MSSGVVQSVSATLCESIASPPMVHDKIDGVSTLANIQISKERIRAWRAYGVNPEDLSPRNYVPSSEGLPSSTVIQAHPSSFSSAVKRRTDTTESSGSRAPAPQAETDEESKSLEEGLFTCPEEGCTKAALRHSTLVQHLDCGKHQRALENATVFDIAGLEYPHQLEEQASLVPVVSRVSMGASSTQPQNMGWILKSSGYQRTRFTAAQKCYLTTKFMLGEQSGKNTIPRLSLDI